MNIGEKLKFYRKRAGYTHVDVNSRTGVSLGSLSEYENNKTEPRATTLRKLCELYDITEADLYSAPMKKINIDNNKYTVSIPIIGDIPTVNFKCNKESGECVLIDGRFLLNEECFAVKIKDGSVKFQATDLEATLVIIDPSAQLKNGDTVLVQFGRSAMLRKRYETGGIVMFTDIGDSREDPIIPDSKEDYKVLGKAIKAVATFV